MKTAVYHSGYGEAKEFTVLKVNKGANSEADTYDIGPEGGEAVVTGVSLSEDGAAGTITDPSKKATAKKD